MPEHNPRNFCTTCRQDFASLEGFDRHRVGAYDPGEYRGPADEWRPELGRRCLDLEELAELGYEYDEAGRWYDPARKERALARFAETASTA